MAIQKYITCFLIIFICGIYPLRAYSMAGFAEWEIAAPGGYFIGCNDKVPEECRTLYDWNYQVVLSDIEDYKFFSNAVAGSFAKSKANKERYFIFETNTGVLHLFSEHDELITGQKELGLKESILIKLILLTGAFGVLPITLIYYFNYEEKKLSWYEYFTDLEYNLVNSVVASLAILLTYLIFSTGALISIPDSFGVIGYIFSLTKFFVALFLSLPALKFITFIVVKIFRKVPSNLDKKLCATLLLASYLIILGLAGQSIIKVSPYFYEIQNLDYYSIRRGVYQTPGSR